MLKPLAISRDRMINLEDSWSVKVFLKVYGALKKWTIACLSTSMLIKYLIKLGSGLYNLSVRSISIIILIVVMANIFLYNILRSFEDVEIGFFGWMVRGILLFVGSVGIFCNSQFKDLKETSLFISWINRNKLSLLEEK